MEYKIVKINTDSICKTRNLFLDMFLNTNKNTTPCQTNQFLKEAIKNTKTKKSRATHPCHKNIFIKEAFKTFQMIFQKESGHPPLTNIKTSNKNKSSYRYRKSTMSAGEYGYSRFSSLGTTPSHCSIATSCQPTTPNSSPPLSSRSTGTPSPSTPTGQLFYPSSCAVTNSKVFNELHCVTEQALPQGLDRPEHLLVQHAHVSGNLQWSNGYFLTKETIKNNIQSFQTKKYLEPSEA